MSISLVFKPSSTSSWESSDCDLDVKLGGGTVNINIDCEIDRGIDINIDCDIDIDIDRRINRDINMNYDINISLMQSNTAQSCAI